MINKVAIIALCLLSSYGFSQAGAPAAPYYNGFNFAQTGTALKNALATKITSTHTNLLSYGNAERAIKVADLDPGSNTNLLLLYGFSPNLCPSSAGDDNDHRLRNKNDDGGGATCEWNREHTYPKSLGNPNLGESGPGSDAHHLRSTDVQRNGERGSKRFADGSGNSGTIGSFWYPGDEWKGDVARMMMYMYLRYGNRCLPSNVGSGATLATDSNMLQLFIEWNVEDPVSTYEDNRNSYLGNTANQYAQGNRNPFIDNPYLATMIWGGPAAENRWPSLNAESFDALATLSIYPNPSNGQPINIVTNQILDEIELVNINGQIMQKIFRPIPSNNIYTVENLPKGFYFVRIKSNTHVETRKIIVN